MFLYDCFLVFKSHVCLIIRLADYYEMAGIQRELAEKKLTTNGASLDENVPKGDTTSADQLKSRQGSFGNFLIRFPSFMILSTEPNPIPKFKSPLSSKIDVNVFD